HTPLRYPAPHSFPTRRSSDLASPLTVPLLAHVLPLTFVLSLAALLDLASGLALGIHTRRQANRGELLVLIPFTLLGQRERNQHRSEEHTSELQSPYDLVCRLL